MPYEFHWHNPEQNIIRVDVVGQISWGEFNSLTDRICEVLAKATERIDLVYNDKVGLPIGNPMPHLKSANAKLSAHKHLGLIITVASGAASSFSKVMIDIMARTSQLDMMHMGGFVASLDEAMVIIDKSRAKGQITRGVK